MESNVPLRMILNNLSAKKVHEAKRLADNTIIVRIQDESDYAKIYCLNEDLSTKWQLKTIFEPDGYPNSIVWDTRFDERADAWDKAYVNDLNSFVTSSFKGFTVTVNYRNGEIINSVFTR